MEFHAPKKSYKKLEFMPDDLGEKAKKVNLKY